MSLDIHGVACIKAESPCLVYLYHVRITLSASLFKRRQKLLYKSVLCIFRNCSRFCCGTLFYEQQNWKYIATFAMPHWSTSRLCRSKSDYLRPNQTRFNPSLLLLQYWSWLHSADIVTVSAKFLGEITDRTILHSSRCASSDRLPLFKIVSAQSLLLGSNPVGDLKNLFVNCRGLLPLAHSCLCIRFPVTFWFFLSSCQSVFLSLPILNSDFPTVTYIFTASQHE